jgi:hypothetical protein
MCIPSIGGTVTSGSPSLRAEICALDLGKVWIQYPASTKLNKEEPDMGRPVGVTILAILDFLGALACIGLGILMFVGGGLGAMAGSQAGDGSGGLGALVGALGAAAGVVFLIFGVISFVLGWGLWKLKNWARLITIILLALSVAGSLFGLVGVFAHFTVFGLIWTLVWVAIYALIIWYLLKADVKAAFQGGQAKSAAA